MDLSTPYLVALSKNDGAVLTVLAGTTRPLSGREVARLSGGSHSTVARTLRRLAEHGLVEVQEAGAGAALLHTLNREHLACGPVTALLDLRSQLLARLTAELECWPVRPLHVSVFGSFARGDGGTDSDIDLLIVRPEAVHSEDERWRGRLDELPRTVLKWTGNHAGIAEVSESDITRLRNDRPAIAEELERDAINLVGPQVRELLVGRSQ